MRILPAHHIYDEGDNNSEILIRKEPQKTFSNYITRGDRDWEITNSGLENSFTEGY